MAGAAHVLQRYARALHELAEKAGAVQQVGKDLHAFLDVLAADPEARRRLQTPRLPREAKREVLRHALPQGSHDLLRRTLMLLVDKGRAGQVAELGAAWDEVALSASGRAVAQVTSAAPLDEATRQRLTAQLARLTGKTIQLQEAVDPALLAGARILVGSRMLDGTVHARLEALRARLMAAPLPAAD
jgi:F-type H+-transporting ATPase subunit delta